MAHKLSLISGQIITDCLWNQFNDNPYNEERIAQIRDNIGDVEVPVTSIPSPFARMHLFETAFKYVNEQYSVLKQEKALNGRTTFHRLISECLDVFELLYFFEELQLSSKLKIISWNTSKLRALQESSKIGQKIFAEVFQLYISNYNKDQRYLENGIENPFNQINILLFNNTVFAGTSPFTGFYTTSNEFPEGLKNKEGIDFFGFPRPLYKRNFEFQKFINLLFESNSKLIQSFPSVYSYIRINRGLVTDRNLVQYLGELNTGEHLEDINTYPILYVNQTALPILPEIQFRCKQFSAVDSVNEIKNSDFVIKTSKALSQPPLALSNDAHKNPHWKYLFGKPLEETIIVPDYDSNEYSKRTLPGFDHYPYPYIIRNDFLSKYIIELPYEVNSENFWMGGEGKVAPNVLLPIKPDYFKFFTIEDLKKNLTITKLDSTGSIHVTLEIPTQNSKIRFERLYNRVNPQNLDNEANGAIIPAHFYLGIYPFFRVKDIKYNDLYKISIFNDDSIKVDCTFYRENNIKNDLIQVPISDIFVRTREAEGLGMVSKYIELSRANDEELKDIRFDFFSVNLAVDGLEIQGTVIPLLQEINNLSESDATLAYDIGTSNSYVAVSVKGGIGTLSTYTEGAQRKHFHLTMLHKPIKDRDEIKGSSQYDINSRHDLRFRPLQMNEFMPTIIGNGSEFNFPIRTIINQDNDCDAANESNVRVLSSINIPFAFGTESLRNEFDNAHSNLKWEITDIQNQAARNRLKAFIEQMALMGRNKILSEGISPAKTNVLWFKPLSMSSQQTTLFENYWKEYYIKYFSKNFESNKLYNVTESWAPFYSYDKGFGAGKYFVNIDIGGGTTDILAFINNEPRLTSSFRFAGNNLFDNGLVFDHGKSGAGLKKDNGFAVHYAKVMEKVFEDNQEEDLLRILRYILASNELKSQDLISFFFGVKGFSDLLKLDKDFALLFLLHTAAIFYHSAQILKASYPEAVPNYIGLSGNGAKLLEIPNKNNDLNRARGISSMVGYIFQYVFGLSQKPEIKLHMLSNPKESTAIGGIKGLQQILDRPTADQDNFFIAVGDEKTIFHNSDFDAKKKYSLKNIREQNLFIDDIAQNYKGFIEYFFDRLWLECDLPNNFGVDKSFNTEKLAAYFSNETNLKSVLSSIINHKMDVEKDQYLTESLFFTPLHAYLYDFSKIVADENELNKFKGN